MSASVPDRDQADGGGPSLAARALVLVTLALLAVPGLLGTEAWPLTGWRLFSLSRDADQVRWVVQAVDGGGSARTVSLEELPLRYRHAEWPMGDLPGASPARRDAVCEALADAVVAVHPSTTEVRIVRDRQHLERAGDGWEVRHDPEVEHACAPTRPAP